MARRTAVFRAGWLLAAVYAAGAVAQDNLEVTMRVVDDVSNLSAVIIAIGDDVAAAAEADHAPGDDQRALSIKDGATPAAGADAADRGAPDEGHGAAGSEDRDVSVDRTPIPLD